MAEPLPVVIKLKRENGVLVPVGLHDSLKYDQFMEAICEGEEVVAMYEKIMGNKTGAQNNYLHKLIRTISEDTGQAFEDVKKEVKIKGGYWQDSKNLKSLEDASKTDMENLIRAAIELGADLGINLYN